jgi:hypothetical protein
MKLRDLNPWKKFTCGATFLVQIIGSKPKFRKKILTNRLRNIILGEKSPAVELTFDSFLSKRGGKYLLFFEPRLPPLF